MRILEEALGFAAIDLFLKIFAFIVVFFAAAESDFDFDEAIFEVEAQGNDGAPAGLDGLLPLTDFAFMEEEFARAVGVVVGGIAEGVLGDMGVVKDGTLLIDADEGVVDLGEALADGFDLGAAQGDACFEGVIDKIVTVCAGIAHFLKAIGLTFFGGGHSASGSNNS